MLPVVGIFLSFFLVVLMLFRRLNLGISLLTGSLVVGLTSTHHFQENVLALLPTFLAGLSDPLTLEMLLLVALVTVLAHLLDVLGFLKKMIASLEKVLHRLSLTLVFIPSLIGALVLPGGAILSAPIIKPLGERLELTGGELAATNIYYRHLWSFSFPYMPGVLVASSLAGIPIQTMVLMHLPIVFLMLFGGYFFLLRGVEGEVNSSRGFGAFKDLFICLLPLLLVIFLPFLTPLSFLWALLAGILLVILMKGKVFRLSMLWKGLNFQLLFSVLAIFIFKSFIQETQGLDDILFLMMEHGIPPLFLAVFFPFLLGMITGNHMGSISIAYPFLLPLFLGHPDYLVWHMVLFSSSFFGYLISPFHLCLILTASFFQIHLLEIYRKILPVVLFSILGIVLLALLYQAWPGLL